MKSLIISFLWELPLMVGLSLIIPNENKEALPFLGFAIGVVGFLLTDFLLHY